MPQGRRQWVIHSLCVLGGQGSLWVCESFVLGLCCRVCIYTQLYAVKCVQVFSTCWECCQPDLAFFSYSRRSRRFLRGKWPHDLTRQLLRHPHPQFFLGHCNPGMQLRLAPRSSLDPYLTVVSLDPYGKAVKQIFISQGLALGSPKLILLQLWSP